MNERKKTITISLENWQRLGQMKLNHGFRSYDDVLDELFRDQRQKRDD